MSDDPIDPTGALTELSQLLRSEQTVEDLVSQVVALAARHIPGADDASITLVRNERASTVAAMGDLSKALDELQYERGYGPCLDAGRGNEIMLIADARTETRWPRYLPSALDHGLGSSLSLPLPVENYLVGALNVYSRTAGAFAPPSVTLADALAAHLTVTLSNAESAHGHREMAEGLERAMHARSVIEQAKGMIMVRHKCTAEAAFDMLRSASMEANIRLQDLATSLVSSASGHPVHIDDIRAAASASSPRSR